MVTARARRAFTLLEMVMTVALVTVVTTVAVVGFAAISKRSESAAARADLDLVHSAQLRFASVYGTYTPHPDDLTGIPPGVTITSGIADQLGEVSIAVGEQGSLAVAAMNANDECIAARWLAYGTGNETVKVDFPSTAPCEARAALPPGEAARPDASVAADLSAW